MGISFVIWIPAFAGVMKRKNASLPRHSGESRNPGFKIANQPPAKPLQI